MKLQKLVYFAHGWYLAVKSGPLISEPVEAWKFGPVVRSVYREFSCFGKSNVDQLATELGLAETGVSGLAHDLVGDIEIAVVGRVWDVYSKFSAYELSNMTHAPGTPWHRTVGVYEGKLPTHLIIPNDQIRDYFAARVASAA